MADPTAAITPSAGGLLGGISPAQFLMAGSQVLSSALAPSPAAHAISSASAYTNVDHGGWTVGTGSSKASAAAGFPWYVWALAGVALIWWMKEKR